MHANIITPEGDKKSVLLSSLKMIYKVVGDDREYGVSFLDEGTDTSIVHKEGMSKRLADWAIQGFSNGENKDIPHD